MTGSRLPNSRYLRLDRALRPTTPEVIECIIRDADDQLAERTRCPRDSDWCDGVICRENGIDCPNADPPAFSTTHEPGGDR